MRGLWAGLVLAGVSPFMPCSSCSQIERFLVFYFKLSFTGFNFAGGESPHCYLTVGSKEVHKQNENRFADPAWMTKKFRICLGDGEVTPWYFFQAMMSNLRHQKSVKKVKKCEEVKVKAINFFCRRSNRWRLPSLLDRRSQLSRVRHWLIMNSDLEGSFVFLWYT